MNDNERLLLQANTALKLFFIAEEQNQCDEWIPVRLLELLASHEHWFIGAIRLTWLSFCGETERPPLSLCTSCIFKHANGARVSGKAFNLCQTYRDSVLGFA